MIEARFDDLTPGGTSFRLVRPVEVISATEPEEVSAALRQAEAAAAGGLWVAGCVAYEAAPGLDPRLRVVTPDPEDPFAAFPLVWFAAFEDRELTTLPEPRSSPAVTDGWRPTADRSAYDAAIRRIRSAIAAGDTYQVNHTVRLRARLEGDPRGLYRDLCYAQRGRYAAYLDMDAYRVLSASPELFFRIDGPTLTTRPMKGTAPRGRWQEEDQSIRSSLVRSVKDRAENAMIVDLLRNDLGRVGRIGTVRWGDVFEPERFETVWQLTSTVSCELASGADLGSVFAALFPSGSVTGAPKVRTMEIIAEEEALPRHAYCGAIGYLAPPVAGPPSARFNVGIRTVVLHPPTGTAEYGVGGGITWGSRAEGEFDEIVAKARVLTAHRPPFELVETMRADADGIHGVERHLDRLAASAAYWGFSLDLDAVRTMLSARLDPAPDRSTRVRLTLDRRGAATVALSPIPDVAEPVRVALDVDEPVDPGDPMLYHKTTLRDRFERARARHPEADDVILTNARGEITESTIANVAVRLDGRWWTPPLTAGLLPGTGRAVALEEGRVVERPISIEEARSAGELALVSDVRGWRRARVD